MKPALLAILITTLAGYALAKWAPTGRTAPRIIYNGQQINR